MSTRQKPRELLQADELVAAPLSRACNDRTFELPPAIHVAMAMLFLGSVTVLTMAFRSHMLVSYVVFVVFIAAMFTVPALWARMKPEDNQSAALSWDEFLERGIVTATGRVSGGEAVVLVLLLPFVVFCWALIVATIAAFL